MSACSHTVSARFISGPFAGEIRIVPAHQRAIYVVGVVDVQQWRPADELPHYRAVPSRGGPDDEHRLFEWTDPWWDVLSSTAIDMRTPPADPDAASWPPGRLVLYKPVRRAIDVAYLAEPRLDAPWGSCSRRTAAQLLAYAVAPPAQGVMPWRSAPVDHVWEMRSALDDDLPRLVELASDILPEDDVAAVLARTLPVGAFRVDETIPDGVLLMLRPRRADDLARRV